MPISQGGISTDAPIPDDLVAIYRGGQYFLDRMKAFENAKASAEAAMVQLQIGNEVLGARADAEEKQRIANQLHDDAKRALDDAKSQSEAMLDDAKSHAEAIVAEAGRKLEEANFAAEQARREADEYAVRVKGEADTVLHEATGRVTEMNSIIAAATAKAAAADGKALEADRARQEFEAAKQDIEDRLARIRAIME